ncbi:hypothetical protein ABPG72_014359 [Tetrahymena utriculariae]
MQLYKMIYLPLLLKQIVFFLSNLEAQQNKTYLVFVPFFYTTEMKFIEIDIIKCKSSELSNFRCLDVSKVSNNNTLTLGLNENIRSSLIFTVYKCQDFDYLKKRSHIIALNLVILTNQFIANMLLSKLNYILQNIIQHHSKLNQNLETNISTFREISLFQQFLTQLSNKQL